MKYLKVEYNATRLKTFWNSTILTKTSKLKPCDLLLNRCKNSRIKKNEISYYVF